MINEIYIYDDILPISEQIFIKEYVKQTDINWQFVENVTGEYGGKLYTHKFPANVHHFSHCKNDKVKSIAESIQLNIANRLNLEFVQNYRWKINWLQPLKNQYNLMDLLHCDAISDHIVLIYYINDSTGDTYIYNNKNGNNAQTLIANFENIDTQSYSLIKKVSPKMGRCVVFNGNLAHHGSYPLTTDRFIINFNFVAKHKNNKSLL